VERKVIAAMRDRVFIGIAELAAAIDEAVDSNNSAPFQKRAGSRREAFLGREKDRLQPLPPTHYEMTVRKTDTVQVNFHVSFDKRYYSVPAAYVRREVGI
ncbi:Mu transposase domain-containing protein, partial [Adlercreutzia equolifaciens]|uniref:Mu transposase domain-containing protein n=1 Tax=Adlercreutzia equolifaciens TaxID=446660 RepID=UPI003C6CB61E